MRFRSDLPFKLTRPALRNEVMVKMSLTLTWPSPQKRAHDPHLFPGFSKNSKNSRFLANHTACQSAISAHYTPYGRQDLSWHSPVLNKSPRLDDYPFDISFEVRKRTESFGTLSEVPQCAKVKSHSISPSILFLSAPFSLPLHFTLSSAILFCSLLTLPGSSSEIGTTSPP